MDIVAVVGLIVFFAIGLLVGRWWTIVVPLLSWPLYFLGLRQDWWGSGLGDGWAVGMVALMLLGAACIAAGIGLRRFAGHRRRQDGPSVHRGGDAEERAAS